MEGHGGCTPWQALPPAMLFPCHMANARALPGCIPKAAGQSAIAASNAPSQSCTPVSEWHAPRTSAAHAQPLHACGPRRLLRPASAPWAEALFHAHEYNANSASSLAQNIHSALWFQSVSVAADVRFKGAIRPSTSDQGGHTASETQQSPHGPLLRRSAEFPIETAKEMQ